MRKLVAVAALPLLAVALGAAADRPETPLERGTYLMRSVVACGNCHTPQGPDGPVEGMELAGQKVVEDDSMTAFAPNITPDPETGIGKWSDEEIIKAVREGFRPDGTIIGPPMPIEMYRDMSDADVKAIVSYLRTVPAVRNTVEKSTYKFPLPPTYGPQVVSVAEPPHDDKVKWGEYLVTIGHCMACHSPIVNGGPDIVHQMGAGGQKIPGPWGIAVTPNITPHEDGIKDWSDEDIKRAITEGVRPDGSKLSPPMAFAYYRNISPEDQDAIVAYLRTIPPKPSPKE
jgi:mono/diheme cytochrome c family protein